MTFISNQPLLMMANFLGSLAEAGSTSSLSTGGVLSPDPPEFSQDEGYSDDDSHYDDFSSDDGMKTSVLKFF